MTRSVRDELDWGPLERAIVGELAVAGSPAFDRLPRPFNARYHDPLPRAVVLCATPADVVETLAFLAAHGLEPAIRSGGHCFAGHSSTSGVVVDVSAMGAVSIDGDLATVGAGARLGAVYDRLEADGRTIPGGSCPAVGIAGLTLGGGLGILGRSYGVTSDRPVAAEVSSPTAVSWCVSRSLEEPRDDRRAVLCSVDDQ